MNYGEARNYIENTGAEGIIPGTAVITELLGRLGNPEKTLKAIHVAGTNGKGAVCAYLEAGLLECGLSVGRYSSPAVFEYLEKIRFMGENITEEDYTEAVDRVRDAAGGMRHKPTSFEAETAAAFLYFSRKKADAVIVECGMGGTYDATNVFESLLVAVITPVGMDHKEYLGSDPYEIAENKAGIMKLGCPAVISAMPKVTFEGKEYDPESFLAEYAKGVGAFACRASEFKVPEGIKNPLPGSFQKVNLQTAICTFNVIKDKLNGLYSDFTTLVGSKVNVSDLNTANGTDNNVVAVKDAGGNAKGNTGSKITLDIFIKGLEKARHPGRYEKINNAPIIIRDGAHNPAAARALRDALDNDGELPEKKRIHLIMGVFKDKDYEAVLRIMLPGAVSFTAIEPPDENRGLSAEELAGAAERLAAELGMKTCKISRGDTLSGTAFSKGDSGNQEEKLIDLARDVFVIFGSLSIMRFFQ